MESYYGCLFSALALIALPGISRSDKEEKTIQVLFIAQFSSILCYALAGLWKVRYIPGIYSEHGLNALFQSLGNTIALEHLTYYDITLYFLNHDTLTGLLFLALIAVQVFTPALVFSSAGICCWD